jgi:hypothetical protein
VSQTFCVVLQVVRHIPRAVLYPATSLRGKHDHLAVGERVYMVFDATIRPSGPVGLEPGAGLKHISLPVQSDTETLEIVYAGRAVVLQWLLGTGGWAARIGGQRSKSRVSTGSNASYLFVRCQSETRFDSAQQQQMRLRAGASHRVCLRCRSREGHRFETELSISSRCHVARGLSTPFETSVEAQPCLRRRTRHNLTQDSVSRLFATITTITTRRTLTTRRINRTASQLLGKPRAR